MRCAREVMRYKPTRVEWLDEMRRRKAKRDNVHGVHWPAL